MSMSNNIEEAWTPEPELRDPAPRRLMLSQYEDLNKPNVVAFCTLGGAVLAVGIICLIFGMANKNVWYILIGLIFSVGGAIPLAIFPARAKLHMTRSENLVTNGVPVLARIVTVTNMTGDSVNGRSVRYQVTLPTGDMVHREVNADDRALPVRVPSNVTALLDPRTNDVELYAALPFRAVQRGAAPASVAENPLANLPTMPTIPTIPNLSSTNTNMPKMDDLGTIRPQTQPTEPEPAAKPEPEAKPEQTAPQKPGYKGLPWE